MIDKAGSIECQKFYQTTPKFRQYFIREWLDLNERRKEFLIQIICAKAFSKPSA